MNYVGVIHPEHVLYWCAAIAVSAALAIMAAAWKRRTAFYTDQVRRDLGPWWDFLPEGALQHDQNAYLNTVRATPVAATA